MLRARGAATDNSIDFINTIRKTSPTLLANLLVKPRMRGCPPAHGYPAALPRPTARRRTPRMSAAPNRRGPCLAALHGMGGHLLLYRDCLTIARHGPWFTVVNLFSHVEREMETTILLRRVVAVHMVRSLLLVQFLRLTYAGAPAETGHYLRDAFAENAFMFSLFDNRPLMAMQARIVDAARAAGATISVV